MRVTICTLSSALALAWGMAAQAWAGQAPDPNDFTYRGDTRRDPFTYFTPQVTKEDPGGKGPSTTQLINDLKIKADEINTSVLKLLKEGNAKGAIEAADTGLNLLTSNPKFSDNTTLQGIYDKLSLSKKAAERMLFRQDAETAFKNLHYKLAGVIARPEGRSLAIIGSPKGRTVQKGDELEVPQGSTDRAVVDEILPGRIIVRFRNYKMELTLTQ